MKIFFILSLVFSSFLNLQTQMEYYKIDNTDFQFIPPEGFISKGGKGMTNDKLDASFIFYSMDKGEGDLNTQPDFSTEGLIKKIEIKCKVECTNLFFLEMDALPNFEQKQFLILFISDKHLLTIIGSMHGSEFSWDEFEKILVQSFQTMKI